RILILRIQAANSDGASSAERSGPSRPREDSGPVRVRSALPETDSRMPLKVIRRERRLMEQGEDRYWRRTSTLMWTMFALWVFFGYVIHLFVDQLNSIQFLGFPLGFYMAAQGSLIAFVVML